MKILKMAQMQEDTNNKVHPSWREQEYPWHRAIWTECAELLDHYGWKWWKLKQPDFGQVRLELVDIWHFGLSLRLQHEPDHKLCAERLEREHYRGSIRTSFEEILETLVLRAIDDGHFDSRSFYQLMWLVGMDMDALFKHYASKNVLNAFRQEHGYQTGEYQKIWNGKEDNKFLEEIMKAANFNDPDICVRLYKGLEMEYARGKS